MPLNKINIINTIKFVDMMIFWFEHYRWLKLLLKFICNTFVCERAKSECTRVSDRYSASKNFNLLMASICLKTAIAKNIILCCAINF